MPEPETADDVDEEERQGEQEEDERVLHGCLAIGFSSSNSNTRLYSDTLQWFK
jgi:hypothetical protein